MPDLYVPYFCRCLWKCPVENFPTASFPFSPSLKCPQNCRLLACAAAEPLFSPPAPKKTTKKSPSPISSGIFSDWPPGGAVHLKPSYLQGAVDSRAFSLRGQLKERERSEQITTSRLCLSTVPLLGVQLHESVRDPTDFSCSDRVAAYTPTNTASDW